MVTSAMTRRIIYISILLTGAGIIVFIIWQLTSRKKKDATNNHHDTLPAIAPAKTDTPVSTVYNYYPKYAAVKQYGMTVTGGTTEASLRTCSLNSKCAGMTFNFGKSWATQHLDHDSAASKTITKLDGNSGLFIRPKKVATFAGARDILDFTTYTDTGENNTQSDSPIIHTGVSVGTGASGMSAGNATATEIYEFVCAHDPNCAGMYFTNSTGEGKAIMRNDIPTSRVGVVTDGVDLYVKPSEQTLFSVPS